MLVETEVAGKSLVQTMAVAVVAHIDVLICQATPKAFYKDIIERPDEAKALSAISSTTKNFKNGRWI